MATNDTARDASSKAATHKILSVLTMALGLILLVYVVVESEPGGASPRAPGDAVDRLADG